MKKISFYKFCRSKEIGLNVEKAQGYQYGDFVIHGSRGCWYITHLDSGMLVQGGGISTLPQAEKLVKSRELFIKVKAYFEITKNRRKMKRFAELCRVAEEAERHET